jgi:hypothetical protein
VLDPLHQLQLWRKRARDGQVGQPWAYKLNDAQVYARIVGFPGMPGLGRVVLLVLKASRPQDLKTWKISISTDHVVLRQKERARSYGWRQELTRACQILVQKQATANHRKGFLRFRFRGQYGAWLALGVQIRQPPPSLDRQPQKLASQ